MLLIVEYITFIDFPTCQIAGEVLISFINYLGINLERYNRSQVGWKDRIIK